MVSLRSGHGPRALVTLHSADCAACREYVRGELTSGAELVSEWGGRIAVVVPGQLQSTNELANTGVDVMQVFADAEGKLARGKARVVIVDEWGEVYFVAEAGEDHDLPRGHEIADWVRFLAIQCPECEGPEGEWRNL